MNELGALFAVRIVRGGLLRSDGVGVGLVAGGAPPWELMARSSRSLAGSDYHRLLLTLDAALDIYTVDQPHDVSHELGLLVQRQERAIADGRELHAAVLGEMFEYLYDLAHHTSARAKQIIWAVTGSEGAEQAVTSGFAGLLGRGRHAGGTGAAAPASGALLHAVERARRLVDALTTLGGSPAPRLLEREEIAQLLYAHADPVRSWRYPLTGGVLERVRRVVSAGEEARAS